MQPHESHVIYYEMCAYVIYYEVHRSRVIYHYENMAFRERNFLDEDRQIGLFVPWANLLMGHGPSSDSRLKIVPTTVCPYMQSLLNAFHKTCLPITSERLPFSLLTISLHPLIFFLL